MYKVLLTDNLAEEALGVFERYPEIKAVRTPTLAERELIRMIPEYHAIIVRSPTQLTREVLSHAENLRFIGRAGAGCDNIDLEEAKRRGIIVMNSSSGNTISTAELAAGMILSLARQIPQAHHRVSSGGWNRVDFLGTELFGKTLGIIGFGRVGREVAKRMDAFSMRVIACDPYVDTEVADSMGVRLVDMDTLLKESHFITIHAPLESRTRALITEREIRMMRDGVYLINCARGGIIDEHAVAEACRTGKIAGVASDVFSGEPPGRNPLLSLPRSVFTPHIGALTREAQVRVAVGIAVNVAEALVSGIIREQVNLEKGGSKRQKSA